MSAVVRYEMVMMLRKRSMWITNAVIVLLLVLLNVRGWDDVLRDPDVRETIASTVFLFNLMLPVGYGCLLADRLIRDTRLGVAPILDATPASPAARLVGKYLGVCAATTVPLAVVLFGFAAVYAVTAGQPVALAWAAVAFAVVVVPAVLFVGAFALTVPLIMPAPLFRVLFVGYWFWGNGISPTVMPTTSQSVLSPIGVYPNQELVGWRGDFTVAGPVPGATLNFLRPEATTATAWLSIGVLIAAAALALGVAQALRVRTTR
ncbi:hypothetical protein [Micromonospora sp. CPCC 206061]|uniref:hypothetical protein n=1 Tax=Micromonospora sp. CPCC 206061 TaxID=3122410 RepID=UPI002FEEAD6B